MNQGIIQWLLQGRGQGLAAFMTSLQWFRHIFEEKKKGCSIPMSSENTVWGTTLFYSDEVLMRFTLTCKGWPYGVN